MFEPSSQALCKVCMPESNLCVALFVRPSKERHQQGFGLFAQTFFSRALQRFVCLNPICSLLCLCDPLREGISKAQFPSFKPHLKGSARLQGFTLRGQCFFSRAQQGFSKASLSKISCQGLCKGRLQRALLFITHSIRHGTGNQQICTPHLLI